MHGIKSFLFHNGSESQTIAKNAFWLFVGQLLSRLLRMVIVVYAARVLGVEGWGIFSYIISFAALLTVLIDFGINAVITREASRDLGVQKRYFVTALGVKIILIAIVAFIIAVAAPYIMRDARAAFMLPFIICIFAFDSLRDFGASLSRAWEKMEIESVVQIFTNALIVIAGFAALFFVRTPFSLAMGYAVGMGIGMVVAFYPAREYFKDFLKNFSFLLVRKIILTGWPLGLLGVMGGLLLNMDTIMLEWFRSIEEVGYYGAVQRIIWLVYIVPGLIATAFFPSMARMIDRRDDMRKMLESGLSILSMIAIPLTVGGMLVAWEIVYVLYGASYLAAVDSFRILCLTFLPAFLSVMFGNALFALNKEKKILAYVVFGVVGNFFFNLILIPIFGIEGAALSTLLNQTLITIYLTFVLKKEFHFKVFHQVGKIVVASVVMAVVTILFRVFAVHVYLMLVVGGVAYFYTLYLLKEPGLRLLWERVRALRG